ncbi:MAG: hypothetical protein KC503_46410 [Myxococcales bacterium]|nr:hypothetical protein [Myxococcales bacterium]
MRWRSLTCLAALCACSCTRLGFGLPQGGAEDATGAVEVGVSDARRDSVGDLLGLDVPDLGVSDSTVDSAASCPAPMVRISDFCIDTDSDGVLRSWPRAAEACMTAGKRLCTAQEMLSACSDTRLSGTVGQWEWTANVSSGSPLAVGEGSCGDKINSTLGSLFETRCCLSAGAPKGVAVGTFFIDQGETDSSSVTWLEAASHCMAAGKRLCSSQEWVTACGNAAGFGIVQMTGQWEWVRELTTDGVARKHGFTDCASVSEHEITGGAYDTRCCY